MFVLILFLILILIYFQTGHTALQRAAAEGHSEVVLHLLERGSPVDHQDEVVRNYFCCKNCFIVDVVVVDFVDAADVVDIDLKACGC
jgi:hypothetical protein